LTISQIGMCFTIEPMVCAGTHEDHTWPDNWTAVTTDGKRSAQFESTLLITARGVEVLTGPYAPLPDSVLEQPPEPSAHAVIKSV